MTLGEGEMRKFIRERVKSCGSQRAFAQQSGISEQYLSDVLRGRRAVSAALAESVGFARLTIFESIAE